MEKVERGGLLAGVGGLGLLGAMFLGWYEAGGAEFDAWESFDAIDVFLALAGAIAVSTAAVTFLRASVSLPVAASTVTWGVGMLAFLLVVFRLIDPPAEGLDREIGIWLGLVATAAIAVGGWIGIQEESAPRGAPDGPTP